MTPAPRHPAPAAIAAASRAALGLAADPPCAALAGAGSDRAYWRLELPGGGTCVVSRHLGRRPENHHFAGLARQLAARGLRVPAIRAEQEPLVWMEDLGDETLQAVAARGNADATAAAYLAAADELAALHALDPAAFLAECGGLLQPPFDAALYRWEQAYFFDHFVARHAGCPPARAAALRADPGLAALAAGLAARPRRLVHRDCQSQNLLLQPDGRVALIDFQGLRPGLPEYDLASLVHDPYVDLPQDLGAAILARHAARLAPHYRPDPLVLRDCAIQRLMQALGAYANLADNAGKSAYLAFIPVARARLRTLAAGHPLAGCLAEVL
jgi:N-acetylmuramate 1-kinase